MKAIELEANENKQKKKHDSCILIVVKRKKRQREWGERSQQGNGAHALL